MDILTKIYKWIEKAFQPIQDFIVKNHGNPLFWIGILVVTFMLFKFIFDALSKER